MRDTRHQRARMPGGSVGGCGHSLITPTPAHTLTVPLCARAVCRAGCAAFHWSRPATRGRSHRRVCVPGCEKTHARLSIAVAKGFGMTVSSRMRYPWLQTNSVRKVSSRSVCPDQSPCSILVKRSCDTVSRASAKAMPRLDAIIQQRGEVGPHQRCQFCAHQRSHTLASLAPHLLKLAKVDTPWSPGSAAIASPGSNTPWPISSKTPGHPARLAGAGAPSGA